MLLDGERRPVRIDKITTPSIFYLWDRRMRSYYIYPSSTQQFFSKILPFFFSSSKLNINLRFTYKRDTSWDFFLNTSVNNLFGNVEMERIPFLRVGLIKIETCNERRKVKAVLQLAKTAVAIISLFRNPF